MNTRKFIALIQDALVFSARFSVISRFSDAQPAASAPARLRYVRIAS